MSRSGASRGRSVVSKPFQSRNDHHGLSNTCIPEGAYSVLPVGCLADGGALSGAGSLRDSPGMSAIVSQDGISPVADDSAIVATLYCAHTAAAVYTSAAIFGCASPFHSSLDSVATWPIVPAGPYAPLCNSADRIRTPCGCGERHPPPSMGVILITRPSMWRLVCSRRVALPL